MPSTSDLPEEAGLSVPATMSPLKQYRVAMVMDSLDKCILEKFASKMAQLLAFHKYNVEGPRRLPEVKKSDKWVYRRIIEFHTVASDVCNFVKKVHHLPDYPVKVQIGAEENVLANV